ncbi:FecR domain-containing protein [Mucilaginibacter mali]|uniref:FecR domain-containing protein n=1 Tax=Mucilaginibacter mali TaxID=2740462 RepID=A0A7D4Q9S3_9SPHI|nr:FecR domain-containing protein [Mucilaginibacter mali]QKJ30305.1 FecR domain-containing protein [Mucilaginibacter mali]
MIGISVFFFRQATLPQLLTINVPLGQLKQLTLPDSSKVWLNAGTTLQYPEKFTGSARHIRLTTGQAFFEVVHDQSKPFIVSANGADVTVLGTSFEVKAFKNEKDTKITVSTGKVGVLPSHTTKTATMLRPNEQASIDNASKVVTLHKVIAGDIASWRQNKLVFEKETLRDVMKALERKYNVKIIILNKDLFEQKITLRLDNQPLTTVLNVLSFSNNFTYKQQNEQLIVVR